eukprot:4990475-Alexandrium_andersonii.AAC.1
MPGDPWGGLVFATSQRKFPTAVRARMREQGLLPTLPRAGASIAPTGHEPTDEAVTEDSLIDDAAAPLAARAGMELLEAIRRTVTIVDEVAS